MEANNVHVGILWHEENKTKMPKHTGVKDCAGDGHRLSKRI